jgi:hypothetical protein
MIGTVGSDASAGLAIALMSLRLGLRFGLLDRRSNFSPKTPILDRYNRGKQMR